MSEEVRPPVRPLSARESGQLPNETLYAGVPPHLVTPLKDWTSDFLTVNLAHRVAATLRRPLSVQVWVAGLVDELASNNSAIEGDGLLDVIDVALQLDERLHVEIAAIGMEENEAALIAHQEFVLPGWLLRTHVWPAHCLRARAVEQLDQLLVDGGSAYEVRWQPPTMLVCRVDPAVKAAVEQAITAGPPMASDLLADAWARTYGRTPEPTTAYRQAVRAVEEVACPLVLPKEEATLGKVIAHLRKGGHKWAFALVDRDGNDTVEPLVIMLDRLWTGQASRHGGGNRSRDQTQIEAETSVHLAATLVHLLSNGALTRRL